MTRLNSTERSTMESQTHRSWWMAASYFSPILHAHGDHSTHELVDALLWCVGAVVVKARIL
jgi:hypothetical protein